MKILAIDVGTGTEDILLYDSEKEIENSMKLVIPSPHLTIGQMISECESDAETQKNGWPASVLFFYKHFFHEGKTVFE